MSDGLVTILDGNTFVVSDSRGDIDASLTDPTGLFSYDTRFLSKWVLTMNGERLTPLSVDDLQYFETRFVLVQATGTVYVDTKLSLVRRREVAAGFHEELTLLNHDDQPVDVTLRIDAASDFADLFEVKDALKKRGKYGTRIEQGHAGAHLCAGHLRESNADLDERQGEGGREGLDDQGAPRAARLMDGRGRRDSTACARHRTAKRRQSMERNLSRWVADAPRVECDWESLKRTYRRSLVDLAALRFSPPITSAKSLPAAGLPWFMTVFGRDSIFTSLQALPFTPELAATTLRFLGLWQGTRVDDFRDEDPGRILHEMRYGEMTAFEERPHSPYYGNADATRSSSSCSTSTSAGPETGGSSASSSRRPEPRSSGSTSTQT